MVNPPQVIAERGEQIYRERYKDEYERLYSGQFVALDVDSGSPFVADTPEGALDAARRAQPTGRFHLIRIGSPGVFRMSYAGSGSHGDWIFGKR
ncbi:MAG: hypothetical protein HY049_02130 [Acidobacteria bacterium]|nr:hypothetical protein [Acidobacteriota bacterium]